MKTKQLVLVILFFIGIVNTPLHAQEDSLEALMDNPEYKNSKENNLYAGLSGYFLGDLKRNRTHYNQYGAQATIEWFLNNYFSIKGGGSFSQLNRNDGSALLVGGDLGFRFYIIFSDYFSIFAEPFIGFNLNLNAIDGLNPLDIHVGSFFGIRVFITKRFNIDIYASYTSLLLGELKLSKNDTLNSNNITLLHSGIAITYLI